MPLDDEEYVARAALWPRVLEASTGLVSTEQVVSPAGPKTLADGVLGYAISVGRLALLPTDEAVHDFGRRVADAACADMTQRKGAPLIRPDETVHYRGSFDMPVKGIHAVTSEVFKLSVEPFPENGLDEHCDIEFQPKDPMTSGTKKKNARTGVIAQLALLLTNPRPTILPQDDDIRHLLDPIDITQFAQKTT